MTASLSGGASGLDTPITGLWSKNASGAPALADSANSYIRPCGCFSIEWAMSSSMSAASRSSSSGALLLTSRSITRRMAAPMRRVSARPADGPTLSALVKRSARVGSVGVYSDIGEVDEQGGVVGRQLALAGEPVDQRVLDAIGE